MRGEGCLTGVFNMMLIDDSFPLLLQVEVGGWNEGRKRSKVRVRLVLRSSDDVMFRRHKQHPHPPPPPLLLHSARFLCSPPFFSGAQKSAFRLVNSTIEMLRISTNQGPGAPSHRYHSNPSQPRRACAHVWTCTPARLSACVRCMCALYTCVLMCVTATRRERVTATLQWIAFSEFICWRTALCCCAAHSVTDTTCSASASARRWRLLKTWPEI